MNSKYLAIAVTALAAITAGLAPLPYGWSRIAATSLAAVLAAISPVNAVVTRTTASKQAGNTKLPKVSGQNT
jgi:uncharacterized membrane protein